ncbi:hypothetical protein GmHk_05G014459 [Glycine max]|nr:hypothetical protein GmHk_05G014459 [Glycine max]
MFGGSHNLFSYFLVDNRHASTHIYKDKVIQLARPNVVHCGGKRKVAIFASDHSENLHKKAKQEWSWELCHITTTSKKCLIDHIQGKKHIAETSMGTK